MESWVVMRNFDGCFYDLLSCPSRMFSMPPTVEETIEELVQDGRVLALVITGKGIVNEERVDDDPIRDLEGRASIALQRYGKGVVTAKNRCGYSSFFACVAAADDPDLVYLDREGIDIVDRKGLEDLAAKAEQDSRLVEDMMELSYAEQYLSRRRGSRMWRSPVFWGLVARL